MLDTERDLFTPITDRRALTPLKADLGDPEISIAPTRITTNFTHDYPFRPNKTRIIAENAPIPSRHARKIIAS